MGGEDNISISSIKVGAKHSGLMLSMIYAGKAILFLDVCASK